MTAVVPLLLMILVSGLFLWRQRRMQDNQIGELKLSSPPRLLRVLKFGLIFLVIEVVGCLAQRYFGHLGFLLVSVVGGLVSSASTTGAAATLAIHGTISPETAGVATALTSVTSALSNLPMIHQQTRNWSVTRRLALISGAVVGFGLATTFFWIWLRN